MSRRARYIVGCSFGKDSLATVITAVEHGEPLDEAVYCEVMFDEHISGEVPEHRDFIITFQFCKSTGLRKRIHTRYAKSTDYFRLSMSLLLAAGAFSARTQRGRSYDTYTTTTPNYGREWSNSQSYRTRRRKCLIETFGFWI